jgi:hypothetical protein
MEIQINQLQEFLNLQFTFSFFQARFVALLFSRKSGFLPGKIKKRAPPNLFLLLALSYNTADRLQYRPSRNTRVTQVFRLQPTP